MTDFSDAIEFLHKHRAIAKHTICYVNNGRLCVDGDVTFRSRKLTELPCPFGIISRGFFVEDNDLDDSAWDDMPFGVGGSFNASRNNFTYLNGPRKVFGDYRVEHCDIRQALDPPSMVGKSYSLRGNSNLTADQVRLPRSWHSLDFSGCTSLGSLSFLKKRKQCKGSLNFSNCGLTEAPQLPHTVAGDLFLSANNLVRLGPDPVKVGRDYHIDRNENLHSWEGSPKSIGRNLVASKCGFMSCLGMPYKANSVYLSGNIIDDLRGLTRYIKCDLDLSDNLLDSMAYKTLHKGRMFPKELHTLNLMRNQITEYRNGPERLSYLLIADNPIASISDAPAMVDYDIDAANIKMTREEIHSAFEDTVVGGEILTEKEKILIWKNNDTKKTTGN